MAEESAITWTDSTYNPWIGCTKVGPGCDFCYAERDNDRRKWVEAWGDGIPRKRTKTFKDVRQWERNHEHFFNLHHRRQRVFSASLADIFDNEVDETWRDGTYDDGNGHIAFWPLVKETPNLDWYIVTKRISNVPKMLPPDWCQTNYGHIVLIITVVTQNEWLRDGPRLKAMKLRFPWLRVGLSIEPMLGRIDLGGDSIRWLDWVICGGESDGGTGTARPMATQWVRALRDQCVASGVPFHFKQWGEWIPTDQVSIFETPRESFTVFPNGIHAERAEKKAAGRKVDGVEHNGFPA